MEIGVQINDNIIISLLDTRDKIINILKENEIRYNIHSIDTEEIMMIPEFETELKLENGTVCFIRSLSSEYTRLFQLSECEKMTVHKYQDRLTSKILNITKTERFKIKLDSLNLKTLCSSITCKCSNTESKLGIVRDGHGNVYIQTIKLLKKLN